MTDGSGFRGAALVVLDGGKALHSAVRNAAGQCVVIQRCQLHKTRNVVDHLTEQYQLDIRCKMLVAVSTGATVAEPRGATAPPVDGSEQMHRHARPAARSGIHRGEKRSTLV
jgi:hypothetical protein